jgi:guanylate kinase
VSCTTRAPREGEQDGVHYHFIDPIRFRSAIEAGDFLEFAEVFGNLYGTREGDVRAELARGRDLILEIDWQGARQVRARFTSAVGIFILPPSLSELEQRLRGRDTDSEEVIASRMARARDEMAHVEEYTYVVVNDRFETALETLGAIVAAERHRCDRQAERIAALLGTRD